MDFVLDANLEEVLSIFEELDLWIELAKHGAEEVLNSYSVEVRSVQAYQLHRLSLVSQHSGERTAAMEHVKERIELAARVGAKRVVTVPAYGHSHAEEALQICVESFRKLADFASERGVAIAIEALSPRRTSFLPSLGEVLKLVEQIDRENVHAMADTMHLHDAGEDVGKSIAEHGSQIAELHLRDTGSLPPGRGGLDFGEILSAELKAELCLEYSTSDEKALREAVALVRELLP